MKKILNYDISTYNIITSKLPFNENKKVILIADLHGYINNKNKKDSLIDIIKVKKPHHIIIAGDIMQGNKWLQTKSLNNFKDFLIKLSEVPIFISLGNHDLVGVKNKNKIINTFKSLKDINNVYPLIKDKIIYDGFEIIGYLPTSKNLNNLSKQKHGIAHDEFIKEYNDNGIKPTKNTNNIITFVGHNPNLIGKSENGIGLGLLSKVEVFYTGHLHNGYLRSNTINKNPDKYLDKGYMEKIYNLSKNGKFKNIKPLFFEKTNLCRGIIYIDNNAKHHLLQLRNGNFYSNTLLEDNKQNWITIDKDKAINEIEKNKYSSLIITGGINKFFIGSIDKPEITEIIYKGTKK